MPRSSLILLLPLVIALSSATALAIDPHLDPSAVPGMCSACHRGHGAARSPMLPAPQVDVCLSCHGSQASRDLMSQKGLLSPSARPHTIVDVQSRPSQHPVSKEAFSRWQPGVVTCTSCHSPHRGSLSRSAGPDSAPGKKMSTRDPGSPEYELCEGCHGNQGTATPNLWDISRLFNPNSRSYHPVEAPAVEPSPSVRPDLTGQEINCTDCHGNDDPSGTRGPHASGVPFLLAANYTTVDGGAESESAYALCYGCHDRERVLDSASFPGHGDHIVEKRASCATCHNAHGSVDNRALIRFGEETVLSGVSASISTGRLAFESIAPGEGSCYVTCHGYDHGPESYGSVPEGQRWSDPLRDPRSWPDRTQPRLPGSRQR